MSDVAEFPSKSAALVGRHVKVVRHGERLWLKVKSARPNGKMVAIVDNHPLAWPESYGDHVEIDRNEIMEIWDDGCPNPNPV